MTFSDRLLALIAEKNITRNKLLKDLNINKSAILNWTQRGTVPGGDTLTLIADYFGVTTDYLLGNEVKIKSIPQKRRMRKIPVYGKVAAGTPITALENIIEYVEIDEEEYSDGDYIALQIKGQSMEPKFSDGDVVIVRSQPDVESGQIAVLIINGDEATVKRLVKHKDGIALVSTNPTYDPMYFSNKEVEDLPVIVFGRVVELRSKF
ncbi:MAG: helix-turn-helix domain-containing protein [Eubacteriales bacterium]